MRITSRPPLTSGLGVIAQLAVTPSAAVSSEYLGRLVGDLAAPPRELQAVAMAGVEEGFRTGTAIRAMAIAPMANKPPSISKSPETGLTVALDLESMFSSLSGSGGPAHQLAECSTWLGLLAAGVDIAGAVTDSSPATLAGGKGLLALAEVAGGIYAGMNGKPVQLIDYCLRAYLHGKQAHLAFTKLQSRPSTARSSTLIANSPVIRDYLTDSHSNASALLPPIDVPDNATHRFLFQPIPSQVFTNPVFTNPVIEPLS